MEKPLSQVKAIFDQAIETEPGQQREELLCRACADDLDMRRRVEVLLHAYEEAESYLESPVAPTIDAECPPLAEGPGTVIGRYTDTGTDASTDASTDKTTDQGDNHGCKTNHFFGRGAQPGACRRRPTR